MNINEAVAARHSVRQYQDKPIEEDKLHGLREAVEECNRKGNLHIQLVSGDKRAFDGLMAHYGKFSGVQNYLALVGPKGGDLNERLGYYGEHLVLLAQTLGLNSCWVGLTFGKTKAVNVGKGERFSAAISLGYGVTQGVQHPMRPIETFAKTDAAPDWFRRGVECAMLAPTAMNQQKFRFALLPDGSVQATTRFGSFAQMDLGIAKYHFELGAGQQVTWK